MSSEGLQREQSLGGDCHSYSFSAREGREMAGEGTDEGKGEVDKSSVLEPRKNQQTLHDLPAGSHGKPPKGKSFCLESL